MSLKPDQRSPIGQVRGLGSAHSGTQHFWRQRVTAVALVPLMLWFTYAMVSMAGAPYTAAAAFLQNPVNAVLMVLVIGVALYHSTLGMQVVIEDYIRRDASKIALLTLSFFFHLIAGLAGVFAVLRVAL
ncbi:MAG: succinate dehydrogenase, hydrophobic membrane anchor protein [Alphaproteobacteria bacterium]|nr:succinate dehydrogenase, hydrophobic membrane anchor protein [Alphaproteobacteria bacterium]